MPGFQSTINNNQAPGVEGDFASANPYASVLAGEGRLVAGVAGVTVGRFAYADADGIVLNSGSGAPTGFVHRDMQAFIGTYLQESSMVIPGGMAVTLMNEGDFWARVTVANATAGQKAFASITTGAMQPGAAGATIAGFAETNFFIRSTGVIGELVKISTHGKA